MPITDQTYIRTCANHVILDKFKEPVPTSSILILNECECDRNHLVVAINSDCHQYLTFIFSSQESVVDTEYRKRVRKCPDACTKTKEGSVKNAWSSDHTREVLDIKMASRISLHNFGKQTRKVIIRRLVRAKPHLEHRLFCSPYLIIAG